MRPCRLALLAVWLVLISGSTGRAEPTKVPTPAAPGRPAATVLNVRGSIAKEQRALRDVLESARRRLADLRAIDDSILPEAERGRRARALKLEFGEIC
jgi:hypothetical protein